MSYITIQKARLDLATGELYAGSVHSKTEAPSYHLVLLPNIPDKRLTWNEAVEWAKTTGGQLPTLREQSLLFTNLKEEFKGDWYWSGDQPEDDSNFVWGQYFNNGSQWFNTKKKLGGARVVRRIPI